MKRGRHDGRINTSAASMSHSNSSANERSSSGMSQHDAKMEIHLIHYLYGLKKGSQRRLVATFGSEQQLLAYVNWATLKSFGERQGKFEQGSALGGYEAWEYATNPLTDEDTSDVAHNPTPSML